MRSAIFALAGFALAGSLAFAQPSDGRLKIIHETATLRVAYRTDSRPFSYAESEEKREPVSDIDTGVADSLKVLDPRRPIREADIEVAIANRDEYRPSPLP